MTVYNAKITRRSLQNVSSLNLPCTSLTEATLLSNRQIPSSSSDNILSVDCWFYNPNSSKLSKNMGPEVPFHRQIPFGLVRIVFASSPKPLAGYV